MASCFETKAALPTKGGLKSERAEGFLHCQRKVPKSYLKLLHPVHGSDKMLIGFNIGIASKKTP